MTDVPTFTVTRKIVANNSSPFQDVLPVGQIVQVTMEYKGLKETVIGRQIKHFNPYLAYRVSVRLNRACKNLVCASTAAFGFICYPNTSDYPPLKIMAQDTTTVLIRKFQASLSEQDVVTKLDLQFADPDTGGWIFHEAEYSRKTPHFVGILSFGRPCYVCCQRSWEDLLNSWVSERSTEKDDTVEVTVRNVD